MSRASVSWLLPFDLLENKSNNVTFDPTKHTKNPSLFVA